MTKHAVIVVESYKLECGIVFYLAVIAALLFLANSYSAAGSRRGFEAAALSSSASILARETIRQAPVATTASAAAPLPLSSLSGTSVWPIHGRVTTEFGAPDYPYQSHHTGIDITSARPAGVIQVAAFRDGTVMQVVHSGSGLGNHVVIDHGGGITSVYGHLYSISTFIGQQVHTGDYIGTEGSTGASTGPHVHFEIRVNGVPQNPRHFLSGNP